MPEPEEMMKRQQVLADFGEFAIRSEDLDEVLTEACRLIGEALGTDRAKVLEIQEGRQELLVRAGVGWASDVVGKVRLPMDERSSETYSIKAGEPVITQDISQEDRFEVPSFMKEAGVVALANVPIFVPGERPYGILQVDDTEPREFGEDEVQFLRTYSSILGPVIDRLKLARERQALDEQRARDLAALQELQHVSTEMVGGRDPQVIYQRIVEAAAVLTRSDCASIQALDPATGRLKLLAWRGFHPESAAFWDEVDADTGSACGQALKTGDRILVPDVDKLDADLDEIEAYRRSSLLSAQSTPLRAYTGEVVGMLSTHWRERRDLSSENLHYFDILARLSADLIERLQASDRLRESEARLAAAFESVPVGLAVVDTAGASVLSNANYCRFVPSGYIPSRDPAGPAPWRGWDADGRLLQPKDFPGARALRGTLVVPGQEMLHTGENGREIWTSVASAPTRDDQGRVTGIVVVISDIDTAKRGVDALAAAEARQRTLMEGIPQLVWRSSDEGLWTWASPQWLAFTGQAQEESHGWGWLDVVHPDDREATMRAWEEAQSHGMLDVEYRLCRAADGAWVWHHTRSVPVRDAEGRIVEWLGTSTDVQSLRELQERQQVLVAELQHRTRNLLGVVRSTADRTIAASESLPDFRSRFRDRLEALARVQGLLSRLEDHDRVTFDELLRTELAAMHGEPDKVTLDGPAGVRLRSSMVQTLAMALHELATNAVKYGALKQPDGHLAVRWSLRPPDRRGRPWLDIDWRESGVDMPDRDAPPQGTGQGRELIEQALPYQLSAETSFAFEADGVHCTIAVPVSASNPAQEVEHG